LLLESGIHVSLTCILFFFFFFSFFLFRERERERERERAREREREREGEGERGRERKLTDSVVIFPRIEAVDLRVRARTRRFEICKSVGHRFDRLSVTLSEDAEDTVSLKKPFYTRLL